MAIVLRKEQFQQFELHAFDRFVGDFLDHVKVHFPNHWRVIGQDELRQVVHLGVTRAERYGIVDRRSTWMYLSVMLYLGSYFDDDVQIPWAARILNNPEGGSAAARAEQLFDAALWYMDRIYGSDNQHLERALGQAQRALDLDVDRLALLPAGSLPTLLSRAFPQKCQAMGDAAMSALIQSGKDFADQHGMNMPAGSAVCTALMFLLGQGMGQDPQFPWAASTLGPNPTMAAAQRVRAVLREASSHLQRWLG
ncbi:hypothetical protein BurJ1DRAFT_2022 [Burkholderiales bacterium JOSHI_001]|nr:hypothetical protein BurJ1DRAFT_2022 [Burkholderiales bacterium JOSHI_001]